MNIKGVLSNFCPCLGVILGGLSLLSLQAGFKKGSVSLRLFCLCPLPESTELMVRGLFHDPHVGISHRRFQFELV